MWVCNMVDKVIVCSPMCLKHDTPRPCPICETDEYDGDNKNDKT